MRRILNCHCNFGSASAPAGLRKRCPNWRPSTHLTGIALNLCPPRLCAQAPLWSRRSKYLVVPAGSTENAKSRRFCQLFPAHLFYADSSTCRLTTAYPNQWRESFFRANANRVLHSFQSRAITALPGWRRSRIWWRNPRQSPPLVSAFPSQLREKARCWRGKVASVYSYHLLGSVPV